MEEPKNTSNPISNSGISQENNKGYSYYSINNSNLNNTFTMYYSKYIFTHTNKINIIIHWITTPIIIISLIRLMYIFIDTNFEETSVILMKSVISLLLILILLPFYLLFDALIGLLTMIEYIFLNYALINVDVNKLIKTEIPEFRVWIMFIVICIFTFTMSHELLDNHKCIKDVDFYIYIIFPAIVNANMLNVLFNFKSKYVNYCKEINKDIIRNNIDNIINLNIQKKNS